jgi:hypothetical protein
MTILFAAVHESAIGPKRTYRVALHMSASGEERTLIHSCRLSFSPPSERCQQAKAGAKEQGGRRNRRFR